MRQIAVAVMAGGQSRRMGQNKAFLKLKDRALIEHVLTKAQELMPAQTMIIANDQVTYAQFGVPVYPDVLPGKGALGGVYSALHYSEYAWVVVVACDMPFLNSILLEYLCDVALDTSRTHDAVVPVHQGRPQGMHAVYHRNCYEPIRKNLDAGLLRIISFYDQVRVRYVEDDEIRKLDPDGLSFRNINTPDDLAAAAALIDEM